MNKINLDKALVKALQMSLGAKDGYMAAYHSNSENTYFWKIIDPIFRGTGDMLWNVRTQLRISTHDELRGA